MRLVSAAVLVLLGCSEGPPSNVAAAPTASALPSPTVSPSASLSLLRRSSKMPPPTRMPDGGVRIDMRGTVRRVHTLERQPDGKYRQACVGPSAAPGSQETK